MMELAAIQVVRRTTILAILVVRRKIHLSQANGQVEFRTLNYTIVIPRWRRNMKLVTFTNFYNPRNRITDRRRRNSRPGMEHAVTACSCRNITMIRHVRFALSDTPGIVHRSYNATCPAMSVHKSEIKVR